MDEQAYWLDDARVMRHLSCAVAPKAPGGGDYVVRGTVRPDLPHDAVVTYFAAAPPDRMTNYAGSGLPFPNSEVAYEGSPNAGATRASNWHYEFTLWFPNAFYTDLGATLQPPHVLVKVCAGDEPVEAVVLGDPVPNRFLTSPPCGYTRSSFRERGWGA